MPRKKAIEYFRVFFETSQAILSSASLPEILRLLVQRTAEALGAKGGSLRLLDEQTHHLQLAAAYGLSRRYLEKGPLHADRSVPEVLQGQVVAIRDAFADPRIQYQQALREEGINTLLSVPVLARDKVIGVLRLYLTESREFSEEEIEFVSALAEMGGLAIANARIYQEQGIRLSTLLREVGIELPSGAMEEAPAFVCVYKQPADPVRSLAYFRALHYTTRTILSTLDSREVIERIIGSVIELMGIRGCALRLINETTRELELLAARGLSEDFLAKGPLHADRSISETLEGTPVQIADAGSDPRVEYPEQMQREGIVSLLSVPIVARERVVGLLRLYSEVPRSFSEDEVAFLFALAQIAGVVIMNARLYEKTCYDLSFWNATLGYLEGSQANSG